MIPVCRNAVQFFLMEMQLFIALYVYWTTLFHLMNPFHFLYCICVCSLISPVNHLLSFVFTSYCFPCFNVIHFICVQFIFACHNFSLKNSLTFVIITFVDQCWKFDYSLQYKSCNCCYYWPIYPWWISVKHLN